jgi:hypothetical protein
LDLHFPTVLVARFLEEVLVEGGGRVVVANAVVVVKS